MHNARRFLLITLLLLSPLTLSALTLTLEPQADLPLLRCTLSLEGGVADEMPPQRGVTALLALLLSEQINEGFPGADVEFQAAHHAIHLNFLLLPERFPQLQDWLQNWLANPDLSESRLEAARRQLAARVRARRSSPDLVLKELLRRTLWVNLPYRHPPEGYPATIQQLNSADIERRLGELTAKRLHLHLRGPLPDGLRPTETEKASAPVWAEAELDAIRESWERMNVHRLQLAIAWPAPRESGSAAVGKVVAALAETRLDRIIRRELKLADDLQVFYEDAGAHALFAASWTSSEKNAFKIRENVLRSLTDLELGQFSEEELEAARGSAKRQLLVDWGRRQAFLAAESRAGRILPYETESTAIAAVQKDEIIHFFQKAFARNNHVYCGILPRDAAAGGKR